MKPDGRNLTPMRALPLLRQLDEHVHALAQEARWSGIRSAVEDVRTALDNHVKLGIARAKRRKARKP